MVKVLALLMCLSAGSLLGSVWTLTTADFQQHDGILEQLSEQGATLQDAGTKQIPWTDVVSLEQRTAPNVKTTDAFVLHTRNGQRIAGEPDAMTEDKLAWKSAMLGSIQVPMEQIIGIGRAQAPLPAAAEREDRVVLQNGDVVTGVVERGDGGIAVQKGASSIPISWNSVRSIALAQTSDKPGAATGIRVRLADGSICLAKSVRLDGDELRISGAVGDPMVVSIRSVQSIVNEAGKVHFLGWLTPSRLDYVPYASFTTTPPSGLARIEQVTVNGKPFRNVVQLRPTSSVTYIAPAAGLLHLRYACGNAGRYTDMSLKILVAEKVAYEAQSVRSPRASQPLDLPVRKGDRVTVLVGMGDNYDVQDFLWLLDAAFVEQ